MKKKIFQYGFSKAIKLTNNVYRILTWTPKGIYILTGKAPNDDTIMERMIICSNQIFEAHLSEGDKKLPKEELEKEKENLFTWLQEQIDLEMPRLKKIGVFKTPSKSVINNLPKLNKI